MKSSTLLLIVAAAAGMAALILVTTSGSEDAPDVGPASVERGSPSNPRLEGNPFRELHPPSLTGASLPVTEEPADLATLHTEYSPGKTDEWPLLRQIESGDRNRPDWWESVVGCMGIRRYTMPVPPFLFDVVFGEGDRAWLERVKASFDAEFQRRTQGIPESASEYVRTFDQLVKDYSALLSAVAAKRAADSPDVARLFTDTTQLRDMEPGSHRAKWLDSMFHLVGHREMWVEPDLFRREDCQYLCAADLRYLKETSMALQSIVRGMTTEQRLDPGTRALVRREVEGLARLIASRK